jgi:hypothetical protein
MELYPVKGKTWNYCRSCQRENLELDYANKKTSNWILPREKFGTGSYQREKMGSSNGKIWNCIMSRGKLGTTVDPASGKT